MKVILSDREKFIVSRTNMKKIISISDLNNNLAEVEKAVECGEPVYLTRNDCDTMVLLSLETYSKLTDGVDAALEESDRYAEKNDKRYSHKEVFSSLRGMYDRG